MLERQCRTWAWNSPLHCRCRWGGFWALPRTPVCTPANTSLKAPPHDYYMYMYSLSNHMQSQHVCYIPTVLFITRPEGKAPITLWKYIRSRPYLVQVYGQDIKIMYISYLKWKGIKYLWRTSPIVTFSNLKDESCIITDESQVQLPLASKYRHSWRIKMPHMTLLWHLLDSLIREHIQETWLAQLGKDKHRKRLSVKCLWKPRAFINVRKLLTLRHQMELLHIRFWWRH